MGTCIEAAVATHRRGHLLRRGAIALSDLAARACLQRTGHDPDELDLLVNAGVYKDFNAAEPALASIIQEDIGANARGRPRLGRHGTFSFDVLDGGCGVTTAASVADGFVRSRRARLAMVVAADVDPSPGTSRGFPFTAAGGALLLRHVVGDAGFQLFRSRTFPKDAALFQSHLRWDRSAGMLRRGRNVVEINIAPELKERCVEHAADVVEDVLAQTALDASQIDLLIASQYPAGFAAALALRTGIAADRVPVVSPALSLAHTAGPIAALAASFASGQWARARHTLFVTAGAGISIGAALYRA